MTKRNELLRLAERVEARNGPDREVDELIRAAVFCREKVIATRESPSGAWCSYVEGLRGKERPWEPRGLTHEQRTGSFTASLDAAMSLAPEEFRLFSLGEGRFMTRSPAFFAQIGRWTFEDGEHGSKDRVIGVGATPALALTAACLRALASMIRGG